MKRTRPSQSRKYARRIGCLLFVLFSGQTCLALFIVVFTILTLPGGSIPPSHPGDPLTDLIGQHFRSGALVLFAYSLLGASASWGLLKMRSWCVPLWRIVWFMAAGFYLVTVWALVLILALGILDFGTLILGVTVILEAGILWLGWRGLSLLHRIRWR